MPNRELKHQTLRTVGQWNAGVHSRLRIGQNGVELFSAPEFDRFVYVQSATDIATSVCGEIFWAALKDGVWQLVRLQPSTCHVEVLLSLSSYGVTAPNRLWWTSRHLWVLDSPSGRLLGFSIETFQLTREIQVVGNLIDADILVGPSTETVYALVVDEQGIFQVRAYPAPPEQEACFTSSLLQQPAALAVATDGKIIILDTKLGRFLLLENGQFNYLGEECQPELSNVKPAAMEIEASGVIYLASLPDTDSPPAPSKLKLFDLDGSFLMQVTLPSSITSIHGLGFDGRGGFYLASNAGIAIFTLSKVPAGVPGTLYPPALDNGKNEGTWHGVSIAAELPAKSGLEIAYYVSDSLNLKVAYDQVLESTASAEAKAASIEALLSPLWKTDTGQFVGSDAKQPVRNMLFVANQGRYLWLRIRLTAYDASSHPSVSEIKVSYPRLSLLRYLPPVYQQEDPENSGSVAFLERFLALFETVFQETDVQVTDLYKYFDPETTPPQFLSWLASWFSLALDDGLPEERKRKLIAKAPELFRTKGTPAGIRNFLTLYTGAKTEVREPSLTVNPFAAGSIHLGQGSVLARTAEGALRIGDSTILGEALLVPKSTTPDAFPATTANRFEIHLDMDAAQFSTQEKKIRHLIRDVVPASTDFTLRLAAAEAKVGSARLEFNARLAKPESFRIGVTSVGAGQLLAQPFNNQHYPAPRLERGAALSSDWRLSE